MNTTLTSTKSSKTIVTLVALVLVSALLSACGNHTYHIVKPGETLYAIGWWYGVDYRKLARINSIAPPYELTPGDKLLLTRFSTHRPVLTPVKKQQHAKKSANAAGQATATATADNASKKSPRAAGQNTENSVAVKSAAVPQALARPLIGTTDADAVQQIHWQWPALGSLLQRFDNSSQFNKGIKLAGAQGQQIYAAAPGKIVYTGNALLGYGNLVIVKHNNEFLSAYGHVRKLLVKEGDYIKAGQQIAEMGSSGTNRVMLHFEIRRSGQPVDPLRFLPAISMVN